MKKRLMAFLLAVVTTVGSLPTAPVFAAVDEYEDVVVEEAGDAVVSADKLTKATIVSENETNIEGTTVTISSDMVVSVNFSVADGNTLSDNTAYQVKITSSAATVAAAEKSEYKLVSANTALYADNIKIKASASGNAILTFEVVSANGVVKDAVKGKLTLKVVKDVQPVVVNPDDDDEGKKEEDKKTDDKKEEDKKTDDKKDDSSSDNEAEKIDYEAIAEAQKDAEGMSAFSSVIDIDPDAQFQAITMVVKQKFQDDALKGFTYNAATKKADKKIVAITGKGKITAKKVGKVELKSGDRIISVNVVKPAMPKKVSVAGGATTDVTISGLESTSVNVVFISSDPAKASVSYDSAARTAYVTGNTKGKVTLTAYVNGKTYKTKVTVTDNKDFVGYINVGTKKSFSVKGVKGLKEWQIVSANGTEASAKKKKITAGTKAGVVSVNGLDKKGNTVISGVLYIQDLDLKLGEGKSASVNGVDVNAGKTLKVGKTSAKKATYEIEVKLDQKEGVKGNIKKGYAKLVFANYAQKQQVVFKSNKAANVYMNGNGVIVAKKSTGKKFAKLTGKVNGKSITIKVKVVD